MDYRGLIGASPITVQVIYRADSIHLDVIDLAQRHALVETHGAPTFADCADSTTMLPVTFSREGAVVELSDVWRGHGQTASASIQFKVKVTRYKVTRLQENVSAARML